MSTTGNTTQSPLPLRVFLASPGDVTDERALAVRVLGGLPLDPLLRGKITLEAVAWDHPDTKTPFLAGMPAQDSVIRSLGKPSGCDIVVVIVWSRLGSPIEQQQYVKPDGSGYFSGTEWEYEDAWQAYRKESKPLLLFYHRTSDPNVQLNPLNRKAILDRLDQLESVATFLRTCHQRDGSIPNEYQTPSEFEENFRNHLKEQIRDILERREGPQQLSVVTPPPIWQGSPFPGLRAFTSEEAAIFFGRGRETDALIARLRDPDQRFLAVVGASGTGKSSLVRAGLLPRLAEGAVEGSQHWCILTFTPAEISDNPLQALATKLSEMLPPGNRKPAREIATALTKVPQRITEYAAMILAGQPTGAALVLIIDQLEELFTLVTAAPRAALIDILTHATSDSRLRVLATVRADFLPQCMAEPQLGALLQPSASTYLLGPLRLGAFADIIQKPAERAGLDIEDDLVEGILKDAGADPGVLPLVAFCLETLYCPKAPRQRLTLAAYEDLGRLRGAIGQQANAVLENLHTTESAALDTVLPQLFRALVHIDAAGTATRRRAFLDELGTEPPIPQLVEALVNGRLLLADKAGGRAIVTLAHEVLLAAWPDLYEWLDRHRAQRQRLQRWLLSLEAPDATDRRYAAETLGVMGSVEPEVVPALSTALSDPDTDVRSRAAKALRKIGPAAAEAVPALITALGDADEDIRRGAARALGQIGPAAVPALITALGDADEDIRQDAAGALEQIGPAAVPALITALSNADHEVRSNAADALGQIGPAAAEAVPALITALGDAEPQVRIVAASALWKAEPEAVNVIPVLITALGDADQGVRNKAADALGQIGPAAAEAVPALITALSNADHEVRSNAADALGQIGPAAAEAVPALITALGDADKNIRRGAARALGQIGPAAAEAVPALITALGDADKNIRRGAARALGQIGPAAVPALTSAVEDRDPRVAQAVSAALKWIRSASSAASS